MAKYILLLGLLAGIHTASALNCFVCVDPNDPNCLTVTQTQCDSSRQDTCLKYYGNFKDRNGNLYTDRTIRTCASYADLRRISYKIDYDRCAYVVDGYDQPTGNTYTGTFCLCDDNLCNSSSYAQYSFVLLAIGSIFSVMRTLF